LFIQIQDYPAMGLRFKQLTVCPSLILIGSGIMRLHDSSASLQRGWNRQPLGGAIRLGIRPGMTVRRFFDLTE
jgi:hypothetical protein